MTAHMLQVPLQTPPAPMVPLQLLLPAVPQAPFAKVGGGVAHTVAQQERHRHRALSCQPLGEASRVVLS
jgi:hypothetical protein